MVDLGWRLFRRGHAVAEDRAARGGADDFESRLTGRAVTAWTVVPDTGPDALAQSDLPPQTTGVELLNVPRPTVAVLDVTLRVLAAVDYGPTTAEGAHVAAGLNGEVDRTRMSTLPRGGLTVRVPRSVKGARS